MRDISVRMSQRPVYLSVGWMNKLQGVEGVDKRELIEESQKEEYTLYVIAL